MTRAAQNFLLLLLGGAVLWITLGTGEFTNYVKPGLVIPLVGSAVLLIVLGLAGLRRDWLDDGDDVLIDHADEPMEELSHVPAAGSTESGADHVVEDGTAGPAAARPSLVKARDEVSHEDRQADACGPTGGGHSHKHGGPRVAWLLCLPVLGIFAIAPPELGAFTAARNSSTTRTVAPPESVGNQLPPGDAPVDMSVAEFIGRSFEAQIGGDPTLKGRTVKLVGFAAPRKEGNWYLTRLQMSCCAADAIALQIIVVGVPSPKKGEWVEITGVWKAPTAKESGSGIHYISASGVTPATKPGNPYE